MSIPEMYLTLVVVAFSGFALTLGGVTIWCSTGAKPRG